MTSALVTGSSRGIGRQIALALAAAGVRVAVHAGRDVAAAERVRDGLPGEGHVAVSGDVASPDRCADVLAAAVDGLDGLDVLVNNAGVFRAHPVDATDYPGWQQAWRSTVEVNLFGPANLTWLFVDHRRHRPGGPAGGRVVNVGSRGAYRGEPVTPAYGASKAALHAMTQSLAVALAPLGIVTAAVAPGFVQTEMARDVLDGPSGDAVRAQSPFGRVARADEVADVVTWLATAAPEWVSGTVVDVNGASYLR
ncbi:SDR family NAD(P)-dependent oxidoreductase [Nakamurella endophytica]|uniref:Epimerase n=1 Tax=Nakamurella endophytica TaxID=1748367 RepID=A0A917SVA7_9ACTN|nr:SDR family oxidoreductase [Nakamurella endophytica]GGL99321.1 epimerase [Nakamurella endophytica]